MDIDIDRSKGEARIELDKPRVLRLDFNAIILFENQVKVRFQRAFGGEEDFSLRYFRELLWAGLVHEDPGLTPEKVGELIGSAPGSTYGEKTKYIMTTLTELLKDVMPQVDDDQKKEEGDETPTGTGTGQKLGG